jgi:hypothetical protein
MPRKVRSPDRDTVRRAVQRQLIEPGSPRLQMLGILIVCGLVAFGVSVGLLRLGLTQMGLRYGFAAVASYAAFFLLIRLWIAYRRLPRHGNAGTGDIPDVGTPRGSSGPFSGGRSGGGGGGASWDPARGRASTVDAAFDLDGAWPIVVVAVCVAGGVIAVGYVVQAAPVLLAEVAVDAAVVSAAYGRLRQRNMRDWVGSVFQRTRLPALALIVWAVGIGIVFQWIAPNADSIGDVLPALIR